MRFHGALVRLGEISIPSTETRTSVGCSRGVRGGELSRKMRVGESGENAAEFDVMGVVQRPYHEWSINLGQKRVGAPLQKLQSGRRPRRSLGTQEDAESRCQARRR